MANVRIKDLTTTAATTASDDFFGVDGATNGTRKLNAYSPTFGGNLTVSGDVLVPTNSAYRLNGKVALLYNGSNLYIEPNNDLGNIIIGASAQTTFGFTVGGNLTVSGTTGTIGSNSGFTWDLGSGGNFTALSTGRPTITAAVASGNNAGAALSLLPRGGGSRRTWNLETDTTEAGDCVLRQSTTEAGSTFTNALYFSAARNATLSGNLTVSGRNTLDYNSTVASHSGLWLNQTSPAVGNYSLLSDGTTLYLNVPTGGTLQFRRNNVNLGIIDGNFLLGTATNSGNGMLQLATHTTSAGGIGFGTDTSLYREAAGTLSINHSGGDSRLYFYNAGTAQGRVESASSNFFVTAMAGSLILRSGGATTALTLASNQSATFASNVTANGDIVTAINYVFKSLGDAYLDSASTKSIFLRPAGTTALTLDSSQRCILSGALRLANTYVATPQVSTGYVTIQDSTGTTYKVLVAT